MPLRDTFAALQSIHGPRLVPALIAALDSGDPRISAPAARAIALQGGAEGQAALLERVAMLPQSARVEAATAVSSMRNALMAAARDARDDRRDGALILLEICTDIEAAEPLAEYLTDTNEDFRQRASRALRALIDTFTRTRAVKENAAASGVEKTRVMLRALRAALESYSRHLFEFVPDSVIVLGGDFQALLTDVLRVELSKTREETGAVERYLIGGSDAATLGFLLDRLGDPLPDVRAAVRRIWRLKRGVRANESLSRLMESMEEGHMRRCLAAARGFPPLAMMAGQMAAYSVTALKNLMAAFAHVQCDNATRIEVYAALGESRHVAVSDECRSRLMVMPAEQVAPVLMRQAREASARAALFALTTLAEMGHPGALKAASDMLRADRADLRDAAARFVAARAYRRYVQGFEHMSNDQRRESGAMLHLVDDDVIDDLRKQICAADPDVRLRALRIVDFTHNAARLKETVVELMHDPDARVRATVVGLLSALRSEDAIAAIGGLLADPDTRVRANAVEAVEALGDKELARGLFPFLEDPNNRIRGNAAKALYTLGFHEYAISVMRAMLEDEAPLMRMSATWAIKTTRPPGGGGWLRARLRVEADEGVRQRLETAVGEMSVFASRLVRASTSALTKRVTAGGVQ
ncbi:MAG: HEAT repeat domain-containing protein [Planctomycetes bacterium]|nr:HEAT repeat domain-containing protein [Planctomycetota bacterium]